MKKSELVFLLILLQSTVSFCQTGQKSFPLLNGPYLGQKPPGIKAELFAPGIISNDVHDSPTFSPDESEIIIDSKYYRMKDGAWLPPEELPFEMPGLCNGAFISPSGKRIYVLLWKDKEEKFYVSEKAGSKWTNLVYLGEEVNSYRTHWQFSSAKNENLYFSVKDTIMISVFDGKKHLKPIPLELQNNNKMIGMMPFIATDESYILYSIRKNKADKFADLYISYRDKNNKWTEPVNLGTNINIKNTFDFCPKISPNGKYLFFTSRRLGQDQVFWADAGFIEELKPAILK